MYWLDLVTPPIATFCNSILLLQHVTGITFKLGAHFQTEK